MTTRISRISLAVAFLTLAALAGCGGTDPGATGAEAVAVDVLPATAVVVPGGTVPFSAAVAGVPEAEVTWSVEEADGGSVDATGRYTAPASTGTFHVLASTLHPKGGSRAIVIVTPTPSPTPTGSSQLGVNVGPVNDWDPTQPFADVMRQARRFGSVAAPFDEKAAVDAQGWPTGDAGVVVLVGVPGMAGTYQLSFKGSASVGLNGSTDSATRVGAISFDAASGRSSAEVVVGPAEKNLFLTFSGQPGGVKDVRLLRPGHTPSDLFHRPFLASLQPFHVLRFMDFTQTNNNPQASWADRSLPAFASQQQRPDGASVGTSWEHLVLLANASHKAVWINLPHLASDDYVTKLAQLLRYGSDGTNPYASPQASPVFPPLDPDLEIYLEWSNELWNGGFSQSTWLGAQADAAIAAGDPDLLYDGNTNHYTVMFRMVGRRSMQISDLFRAVFGDAAMFSRVRPVLPAQIANAGTLTAPLDYLAARHGGAAASLYAVTGAPYVTVNDDGPGTRTGLTLDTIFSEMNAYAETSVHAWMRSFSKLASDHGLKLVAYEAGQHLYGLGSLDAKLAAQSDPRMKDLLLLNFANWQASGGDLYIHYSLCSGWNRYGSWGLSQDIASSSGPKWDAIRQMAGQ